MAFRADDGRRLKGVLSWGCFSISSVLLLLEAAARSTGAFVVPGSLGPGMFVRRFGGGGGDAPGGAAAAVPNAAAQAPSSLYLGRAASLGRPSKMFRRRTHLSMEVIANNPVRNSRVYGRQSDEGKTDKSVPDMNEEILESGVRTTINFHFFGCRRAARDSSLVFSNLFRVQTSASIQLTW